MQFTIIALGGTLAVLTASLWWVRTRRAGNSEARCRRDIAALRRASRARGAVRAHQQDVWSAGAEPDRTQSGAKKSVAWATIGSVGGACGGGCGAGCGGGGCGGCGGCGG